MLKTIDIENQENINNHENQVNHENLSQRRTESYQARVGKKLAKRNRTKAKCQIIRLNFEKEKYRSLWEKTRKKNQRMKKKSLIKENVGKKTNLLSQVKQIRINETKKLNIQRQRLLQKTANFSRRM